jgi:putative permease
MPKIKDIFSILFLLFILISLCYLTQVIFLLALAYAISRILAPTIHKLSSIFKNRVLVLSITFMTFWTLIVMIFTIILPQVYNQTFLFITKIPEYEIYIKSSMMPYIIDKIQMIDPLSMSRTSNAFGELTSYAFNAIVVMMGNIWDYTKITIDILLLCALLPIVSFYFVKDGNLIPKCLEMTKPFINEKAIDFILDCASLITKFLKGQLNVCLIMMLYYVFFLSFIKVDFALLLGIVSGASVAIPFIGIICSILLSSIITIVSFGIDYHLAYVLMLYVFGQIVEGYFVTPRIIGDKIGLHPLLMILALIAFSKTLGIIGMLIAIPIICILKTLFKHLRPYL